MGPARALDELEKFRKNILVFFLNVFFSKIVIFDIRMTFFNSFNMFFRFLTVIRFRTIMKLPKKQVLEPKRAVLVPPPPPSSNSLTVRSISNVCVCVSACMGAHVWAST